MASNDVRRYWKDPNGAEHHEAGSDLAPWMEPAPGEVSRRNFLRAAGFTAAIAAAGCGKAPVEKALPLTLKAEGVVPGRARYFATTCGACEAGCGALVKSRDGRPIKLEGLPDHPLNRGGLCAVGQASLLGLYDSHRLADPVYKGTPVGWPEADAAMRAALADARNTGGSIRVLTGTITSPSLHDAIDRFTGSFDDARHVMYDGLSCAAILDAHALTHGVRALPRLRFDRCDVILSVGADFLGTWISPVEFAAGYRERRRLDEAANAMSYHVHLESWMSLTGSNADQRYRIAPGDEGPILSALAGRIAASLGGGATDDGLPITAEALDDLAARLMASRGRSLVVCGSQDVEVQRLCNLINEHLGNYGVTVDLAEPSNQKRGNDAEVSVLLDELRRGNVAVTIIAGVNPVYDLPEGEAFASALNQSKFVVYCGERPNETSACATLLCPEPHFLESWGDVEPVAGIAAIRQPLIRPLFNSRPLLESLLAWIDRPTRAYDAIQHHWRETVYPRSDGREPFQQFWDRAVHDGWTRVQPKPAEAFGVARGTAPRFRREAASEAFTLVMYPKIGQLDGRHAYNPWLHELPDPVSKVTWDNYACVSVATARAMGIREGDVIRIEAEGIPQPLELPAYIQPGQHDRVVAVAVGYGQQATARFAGIGPQWIQGKPSVGADGLVGKRVSGHLRRVDGRIRYDRPSAQISNTGRSAPLASTQTHHTITVPQHLAPAAQRRRPILQEATLEQYLQDPHAGSHAAHHDYKPLYPDDHPKRGHHWAMAIDLSACTGCSACLIACQSENNIPVVGKDEVRRRREMHWLRVDRYYSGDGDEVGVAHQPMMCQHCDNAPCENVCPVLATVHTEEGLNAQVYNRCVGTRYCANNCPYKVRRFNWFQYRHDDPVENLVLNPDVTVRSRGIMEKCSFCVQRIQDAKFEAKRHGTPVADGAVQPACQQSCPTQAIVFGDLNDPESRVAKLAQNPRRFRVLEEIDVQPSVMYMTLVRNRKSDEVDHHG